MSPELLASLKIMGLGMLGIFLVMSLIALIVFVTAKIASKKA